MSSRDDARAYDGFDQRVHDAYEQVTLSEEAEDRMLAALLAAQAERSAGDVGVAGEGETAAAPAPAAAPTAAPATVIRPKRWAWVALPAAACLIVALIAGRALISGSSAASTVSDKASAAEATYEQEAESADAAALEPEAASPADGAPAGTSASVEWMQQIQLDDGRTAQLVKDEGAPLMADEALLGELIGEGWVADAEAKTIAPCEAYSLMREDGGADDAHIAIRIGGKGPAYLAELDG